MGLHVDSAASLLLMMLTTYICEAALLRKSSASDFLKGGRDRRTAKCFPSGSCSSESSESEEVPEAISNYEHNFNQAYPGGSLNGMKPGADSGAEDEGSGM